MLSFSSETIEVLSHISQENLEQEKVRHSDNGDGTYTNPPLYADYPDPDIIRVANDFHFATTAFVNSLGLRLLHSQDLVNWEIIGHVMPRLEGITYYGMDGGVAYLSGVFAPSLRYHDGFFYIAVTPPGLPIHIFCASSPLGTWEHWTLDNSGFDPSLFFDESGAAFITATCADGTIRLLSLSSDLKNVLDERVIHYFQGAEGSKVIRRGEWYYLFNAVPRLMALIVSRSKNPFGPWETRNQIDDTAGGHQGALVDLPNGDWYGFVMVDAGAIGRMTNISPVFWQDDWPVWGTPDNLNCVPLRATKPIAGKPLQTPATSDDFSSPTLGLQWAWNHNPDDSRWSLTERPGFLRLKATQAEGLWTGRNTLTQKGQGPYSKGEVKLDLAHLHVGDICGFGTLGKFCGYIGVSKSASSALSLGMTVLEDTLDSIQTEVRAEQLPLDTNEIWLHVEMDFTTQQAMCSYSLDGNEWTPLGGIFPLAYDWRTGTFQGPQYAIFCFNSQLSEGFVDIEHFHFCSST